MYNCTKPHSESASDASPQISTSNLQVQMATVTALCARVKPRTTCPIRPGTPGSDAHQTEQLRSLNRPARSAGPFPRVHTSPHTPRTPTVPARSKSPQISPASPPISCASPPISCRAPARQALHHKLHAHLHPSQLFACSTLLQSARPIHAALQQLARPGQAAQLCSATTISAPHPSSQAA